MRLLILLAAAGLSACGVPAPTNAVPCLVLGPVVGDLRAGLQDHPETPDAVAEPATDVVLGTEAVCK